MAAIGFGDLVFHTAIWWSSYDGKRP